MIRVVYHKNFDPVRSWAFADDVEVVQSDDQAGVIVRQKNGRVTSCSAEELFESREAAKEAEIEFFRQELARVVEAYEKKIESLAGTVVVG